MKTWLKMMIVTVVVAAIAVPLGQMLWPTPEVGDSGAISSTQMGLLIMFSIFEALALGFGVAFLIFGLPLVSRARLGSTALTWGAFLSIGWFLVSWWPHDGFHRSLNGIGTLLMVEYGFHGSLMIAGVILALAFMRVARNAGLAPQRPAARPAAYETATG